MTDIQNISNFKELQFFSLHVFLLQMNGYQANANHFEIRGGVMLQVIEDQLALSCVRFEADQAEESLISVLGKHRIFYSV